MLEKDKLLEGGLSGGRGLGREGDVEREAFVKGTGYRKKKELER